MRDYKLLALDLDGTTLTDDKKISEATRTWVQRAVDAGVTVIFSTGRGIQTAGPYWETLHLDAPMVLLNGADVWKGPGQMWQRQVISRDVILQLHQLATEADASFWGYSAESHTVKDEWTEASFEEEWMKFGIRHDDSETLQQLRGTILGWDCLEVTSSAPVNLEMTVKGTTKKTGVQKVCALLGIEMGQVVAVGDSFNDLCLIRAAGLGVAMGNAAPELKEAADVMTDTNEQDGVAKAIQQYLLNAKVSG